MVEKRSRASLELLHVRHATFGELSEAGYSIQLFDDGATPLQMGESMLHNMPDHWNQPDPVIAPKVATLKGATLFHDGSALLLDGRYSNFDQIRCQRRIDRASSEERGHCRAMLRGSSQLQRKLRSIRSRRALANLLRGFGRDIPVS